MQNTTIKLLPLKEAKPFIETWHYSKKVPTGKNIFFGWFYFDTLYAVADYGIGVNSYQAKFLQKITKKPVSNSNFLELKRLCRTEPKNENLYLTQFLSLCHKELKKMGYKYVVSFSDPEQNHNGGIYKAANFKHLGKTNPEIHVIDENGIKRHRKYPYRYSQRKNISIQEARKILKLTRIKTCPKDRWFIEI